LVRPAGRTCWTVNIHKRHVSLLAALQWEGLAEGQLRRREATVGRKPMAKRWPDEQQPHTRRTRRIRSPISLKSKVCTEDAYVDAAGISGKAGAQYPGRSPSMLKAAIVIARSRDVSGEVSRGHSSPEFQDEGLNRTRTEETAIMKPSGGAEGVAYKRSARLMGAGRNAGSSGTSAPSLASKESPSTEHRNASCDAPHPSIGTAGYVNRTSGGVGAGGG